MVEIDFTFAQKDFNINSGSLRGEIIVSPDDYIKILNNFFKNLTNRGYLDNITLGDPSRLIHPFVGIVPQPILILISFIITFF